jgi:hypothetical protein
MTMDEDKETGPGVNNHFKAVQCANAQKNLVHI